MTPIKYLFVLLLSMMIFSLGYAKTDSNTKHFSCVLTVNKAKDWNKQTLIVELMDYKTKQVIATFKLTAQNPQKNKPAIFTQTKTFNCGLYPETEMLAYYYPPIWSTNKGKKYPGRGVFKLENQIAAAKKNNDKELNITVDFPKDFVNVPVQVNL